jgi:hypothetical protein
VEQDNNRVEMLGGFFLMGYLFDLGGSPRDFHESDSQQQEALAILRHRKLTKISFEQDWTKNGSRLAPAIDILRNGWGFEIAGSGTTKDPYWMLNPKQWPSKVRTSDSLKLAYYETEHWKNIRERRFQFDDYRCVQCVGSCQDEIQCHHICYNLFNESLDELVTVCRRHHELIHESSLLKFPTGISIDHAERLLGGKEFPFEKWLLP